MPTSRWVFYLVHHHSRDKRYKMKAKYNSSYGSRPAVGGVLISVNTLHARPLIGLTFNVHANHDA